MSDDVDILRRRMDSSVLLIKALGGGWNVAICRSCDLTHYDQDAGNEDRIRPIRPAEPPKAPASIVNRCRSPIA